MSATCLCDRAYWCCLQNFNKCVVSRSDERFSIKTVKRKKSVHGFHQWQLSDGMKEFLIQASILYQSFRPPNYPSSTLLIRTTPFCFELSAVGLRMKRKSSLASMASLFFSYVMCSLKVLNFLWQRSTFSHFRECLCKSVRKILHIFIGDHNQVNRENRFLRKSVNEKFVLIALPPSKKQITTKTLYCSFVPGPWYAVYAVTYTK